jgi:hypothetical protein
VIQPIAFQRRTKTPEDLARARRVQGENKYMSLNAPTRQISYVPFSDSVEKEHPAEAQAFSELTAAMRHISEVVNDQSVACM